MKKISEKIYLDYSATTKVDRVVLDYFNFIAENFYANPNSRHNLGKLANDIVNESVNNISSFFGINNEELIFTSGATESNNTVLKGIYNGERKQIITTKLEHSSIYGPLGYLQQEGYTVDFASLKEDGTVDLKDLENLLSKDTLLVSIAAVESEIGIRQPVEKIGKLLKKYPEIYFHSDITQCLGKDEIDISNIDLASFSGHKLYCFKGIGGLIKKNNVKIQPIIHGGKSVTTYRSGTPSTELIGSLSKAFDLFKNDLLEKKNYITELNNKIRKHLEKYNNIKINSPRTAIPNILNISFLNKNSDLIQEYFEKYNIFISTKTACASDTNLSKSVLLITNDEKRATSSVRISLSYKTTINEIDYFLKVLDTLMENYNEIN